MPASSPLPGVPYPSDFRVHFMNALQVVKQLFATLALVLLCVLTWEVIGAVRYARAELPGLVAQSNSALVSINSAAQHLDAASAAIQNVSEMQIQAADEEIDAFGTFKTLLDHTDTNVNGKNGLLPTATALLADTRGDVNTVTKSGTDAFAEVTTDLKALQPIMANATTATQEAATLLADPNITKSTAQAAAILSDVKEITASLRRDADMAEARLKQALKPGNFIWNLIKQALRAGADVSTIVK